MSEQLRESNRSLLSHDRLEQDYQANLVRLRVAFRQAPMEKLAKIHDSMVNTTIPTLGERLVNLTHRLNKDSKSLELMLEAQELRQRIRQALEIQAEFELAVQERRKGNV